MTRFFGIDRKLCCAAAGLRLDRPIDASQSMMILGDPVLWLYLLQSNCHESKRLLSTTRCLFSSYLLLIVSAAATGCERASSEQLRGMGMLWVWPLGSVMVQIACVMI